MDRDRFLSNLLLEHGIQPSTQRWSIAKYVLFTDDHPSAEDVWTSVGFTLPKLSRATVYNTLNLFVKKGLLRQLVLEEGKVVFDPKMEAHHHFIDERTGRIEDVPWNAVSVSKVDALKGYDVHEYMVVMRGRKTSTRR